MKYFDNTSTTAVDPEVLKTYQHVLETYYINSEAIYPRGMEVKNLMEKSRSQIARFLAVQPKEIIFTSGGSEANNLAIKGTALARREVGRHIITSVAEHSSVINSCKWLEKYFGCEITYLPVNQQGSINIADLQAAIREDTILVSLMAVNNESGAINPLKEIKAVVKKHHNCYLHIDCVQALAKNEIDLSDVDLASFSAHKINGLKGSGFLMARQHVQLAEVISGGQQENHLRGGTANSPANMVLAKTMRIALEKQEKYHDQIVRLHDYLYQQLQKMDKVVVNSPADGTPYLINFSALTVTSQVMMNALAQRGFEVSAQSTCDSQDAYSKVISAMYKDPDRLKGTIRVSLNYEHQQSDIDELLKAIKEVIELYG